MNPLFMAIFVVVSVIGSIALLMWVIGVWLYYTDAMYAAEYGRPRFWPFCRTIGRK